MVGKFNFDSNPVVMSLAGKSNERDDLSIHLSTFQTSLIRHVATSLSRHVGNDFEPFLGNYLAIWKVLLNPAKVAAGLANTLNVSPDFCLVINDPQLAHVQAGTEKVSG